jgi:hypothetical protein
MRFVLAQLVLPLFGLVYVTRTCVASRQRAGHHGDIEQDRVRERCCGQEGHLRAHMEDQGIEGFHGGGVLALM